MGLWTSYDSWASLRVGELTSIRLFHSSQSPLRIFKRQKGGSQGYVKRKLVTPCLFRKFLTQILPGLVTLKHKDDKDFGSKIFVEY